MQQVVGAVSRASTGMQRANAICNCKFEKHGAIIIGIKELDREMYDNYITFSRCESEKVVALFVSSTNYKYIFSHFIVTMGDLSL